jgi:hypothetical protein
MAVTSVLKRIHVLRAGNGTQEFGTATLAGTYVTNGFTTSMGAVTGGAGSSPFGGQPIDMRWVSPLGYIYVTTFAYANATGWTATTKIFTSSNTEAANGAAVEASVPFVLTRRFAAY